MYFWTCWYMKRYRLTIYVTVAVVVTILGALPDAFDYRFGHWALAIMTPERVALIWSNGVEHILILLLVILLFAAGDLGALAMGDDLRRRDLDFLLTRPRPRHYFIWTSYLAGLTELIVLWVVPILTSVLTLFCLTHALLPGPRLRVSLAIFAMAALMYALVFLLATLTGSAQNGMQFGAFVVFLYAAIHWAHNELFFNLDYRPLYFGAFDWFETTHQIFPLANFAILLGLTLMLPFVAQAGFKRRDL